MRIPASLPPQIKERLRTTDSGCWTWKGSYTSDGHPQINHEGKTIKLMPFLMRTLCGEDGYRLRLKGLSNCLVAKCCNPYHYEWAPESPKIRMPGVGKGNNPAGHPKPTQFQGEKNGRVKLNAAIIKAIRYNAAQGHSYSGIVNMLNLNVSATQVRRIVKGENWRHV